jgi:hypothetical protein
VQTLAPTVVHIAPLSALLVVVVVSLAVMVMTVPVPSVVQAVLAAVAVVQLVAAVVVVHAEVVVTVKQWATVSLCSLGQAWKHRRYTHPSCQSAEEVPEPAE